jgi:hypothetical protein
VTQGYVQAVACSGLSGVAVIAVGTSRGIIAAYQTVGPSDPQQIGKAEAAGAVQSISIILDPLEVCPFLRHEMLPFCHGPHPRLSYSRGHPCALPDPAILKGLFVSLQYPVHIRTSHSCVMHS